MCLYEPLMLVSALVLWEQVLNAQSRNNHHPAGLLARKTKKHRFAEKQIFIFYAYFQYISSAAPSHKYELDADSLIEKALRLKSTKN